VELQIFTHVHVHTQTHGLFMGVALLTWLSSKIKMQNCSKWPIRENFHPRKFPTTW